MKKVYVKYGYTDNYGRACEEDATCEWFDTMEEAKAWNHLKEKRNGGYWKCWKIAEGDYDEWLRYQQLVKEVARLSKVWGR